MAKLTLVAQNICGAPSRFLLLGQEPAEMAPIKPGEVVYQFASERARQHTVITIESKPVEPGRVLCKEAELDYDVRTLSWVVPHELRRRFRILRFTWGDHSLLATKGII